MLVAERPRTAQIARGTGPLLLAHPARHLADYRACGGYAALARVRANGCPEQVVAAVEAAGLRRRAGAGQRRSRTGGRRRRSGWLARPRWRGVSDRTEVAGCAGTPRPTLSGLQ